MSSFFDDKSDSEEEDVQAKKSVEGDSEVDTEDEGSYDEADADFLEDDDEDEDDDDEEDHLHSAIASKIAAVSKSQNRADFLSATEIRHLTAAFEVCDKAETGELAFGAFMKCLSVMGKKVTKAEAQLYFDRMDADKSGFITLDEWIGFYANFMQFDVDEKELLDSFIGLWQQPTALFPETCQRHEEEEYIPKEKMFEIMTKYGDNLADDEAAEMIRECKPDEMGRIFFENYRTMLIDTTV